MSQITSGRVVYSRTVQPAQYESKRAEVELAFVIEDGDDPAEVISTIGGLARAKAIEIIMARDATDPGPGRRKFQARGRDD